MAVVLLSAAILIKQMISVTEQESDTFSNVEVMQTRPVTKYNAFVPRESDTPKPQADSLPDWQQTKDTTTQVVVVNNDEPTSPPPTKSMPTTITDEPKEQSILPDYISDLWSWLPTKQPSTSQEQTPTPSKTPLELAIYDYGNEVGNTIKEFTLKAGDQPQLIQNFVDDRESQQTGDALLQLGQQYITLSESLKVAQAPIPLVEPVTKLSEGYKKVGEATIALVGKVSDKDLLDEIYRYNATVDEFAKSYIKFAKIFKLYGIKFNKGEGGDIFMPPSL